MSAPGDEPRVLLAEQTAALTLYLEALFADTPMSLPVPVAAPAPERVAARIIDLPATHVQPVIETVPVVTEAVQTEVAVVAATAVVSATTTEDPRPEWAREPFPCLLLKVHGLSLALPLVKLNRILPWRAPTPIPGYVAWLLGMLQGEGLERNLKVVDTAALVMPERRTAAAAANPAGPEPRHIVMVGDGEWGLTCEDVSNVITIDPAQVRWRTSRSKRPWLAGTVVEHLCALLDAEQLAEMLSAGAPGLSS